MRLMVSVFTALMMIGCGRNDDSMTRDEERIIALVLKLEHPKDGYTVVNRRTNLGGPVKFESREIERLKEDVELPNLDISQLVDLLVAKNRKEAIVGLKSDQRSGYLVDADGSFQKYWEGSSWDWEKMQKDRPKARSLSWVSRPAFDKKSGIVLIYLNQLRSDYDGEGFVIVYEYKNGKLKELKRVMIWIS